MIVAVDTNFLLELVLQQAEVDAADAIVRMAEAGEIRLAIPAFSFAEARTKLVRQARKRKALHEELRLEAGELTRSRPYRDFDRTRDADFRKLKEFLAAVDCQLILGFRAAVGAIGPRRGRQTVIDALVSTILQ